MSSLTEQSCLTSSDYVYVSRDSLFQSTNGDGSAPKNFRNSLQENGKPDSALSNKEPTGSVVLDPLVLLEDGLKDSIGFGPPNEEERTDHVFNNFNGSGQESFAVIDQSQTSPENSPRSPVVNPLLSKVIGNIGSRLIYSSDSVGTLTQESQGLQPTEQITESRESDIFKMSTTESSDSIIVLEDGDFQSYDQASARSGTSNHNLTNDSQGESSNNRDFSLVSNDGNVNSHTPQADEEMAKDQSIQLESFDGFESLLNTRDEQNPKEEENELNRNSLETPSHSSGHQMKQHVPNLSSRDNAGCKSIDFNLPNNKRSLQKPDDLKSFEVPRNSLEWWPEEMKKAKSEPDSFSSYQMLPDNVGASLETVCSESIDTSVKDTFPDNNLKPGESTEKVFQRDIKSMPYQSSSAKVETSLSLQSFPVARTSEEEESLHDNRKDISIKVEQTEMMSSLGLSHNKEECKKTSLDAEQTEVLSSLFLDHHQEKSKKTPLDNQKGMVEDAPLVTSDRCVEYSELPPVNHQNTENDSDFFGARDDRCKEQPADQWSFLVKDEEAQYCSTQSAIEQTLNKFVNKNGSIGREDIENVSKLLTDVLMSKNIMRKEIEKNQKIGTDENFVEIIDSQESETYVIKPIKLGAETGATGGENGDFQQPQNSPTLLSTPQQYMLMEKVDLEDHSLEVDCTGTTQKKKAEELEEMTSGSEHSQTIPVSSVQLRLLSMLDGKSVLERKYNVTLAEKFEDKAVDIKGSIESIQLAIKSIQNNEWLGGFSVRTTKLHPLMVDLLSHDAVVQYLDQEILSGLGVRFCWLPEVENNYLIVYSDTEQNAPKVLTTILKTVELNCIPKPRDLTKLTEKMSDLTQKYHGRIIWSIEEDSVYIACCSNLNHDVNSCLQSFEVKAKPEATEKFVEIHEDVFSFLKKRKMFEIENIGQSHCVGIEEGPGSTPGFVIVGTQENIQAAVDPILDLRDKVSTTNIAIKSPGAAELFRMNDYALVKYLERHHCCVIKTEDSGISFVQNGGNQAMAATKGRQGDVGFPAYRIKDQIDVHIFCGDTSEAEVDMLIEPADRLEKTPYGQSRFLYVDKLERKAARVVVPKWNTGSGKVKHELIDILVDLFEDLQKYGHESVAFPMRSFKDWPHGRLTKTIIIGLQTHIEKYRKACRLKRVTLSDPEKEICAQICQVCFDAMGDTIRKVFTQPQGKKRQGLAIKLVKGEIANQKREAIVNTTSLNLDLDSGKVSRSILRKAGGGIQDQLRRYHPKGITQGEVAVTRGFSLDCRFVYHGALDYWPSIHDPEVKKTQCLEMLEKFVKECLNQAIQNNLKSIAFPALGCGILNMPPVRVAQKMFQVFRQFEQDHPNSSLTEIDIVIIPTDTQIFKEFDKELRRYKKDKSKPVSREQALYRQNSLPAESVSELNLPGKTEFTCEVNGITLTAALGDVTKQHGYDGLVRLFTSDNPFSTDASNDPLLRSMATGTTKASAGPRTLSYSKNFVTPAADLPQKKIVHVHASQGGLPQAVLTALNTAEGEGDLKSLVIPARPTDPLCEDNRAFLSSVYQAVARHRQQTFCTGRIKKVKICVTEQKVLNRVLEELQSQSAQGETTLQSLGLNAEQRLMTLRLTISTEQLDHVTAIIRNMESSPEKFVDYTMEAEREISEVPQDVYEAFLYFYQRDLQTELNSVNMSYDGRRSKIVLVGSCETLEKTEALLRQKLQELTERMHVDTIPLPNLENPVLQSIVSNIQPQCTDVLLFNPIAAEQCNGIHLIAMTSQDASRVKDLILEKISPEFNTSPQENSTTSLAQRQAPTPVDFRNDVSTFITDQDIQVFVYEENILQLPVACIVNAANEYLSHGSGVAFAILDAAGKSFNAACKAYIRRNGLVKTGSCAATEAGNLPYAYIIHAVGPIWNSAKAEECKALLRSAVESSILKAAELGMDSVGLPAISSGIFGMPVDVCATQYAHAVISASAKIEGSSLREIHFIDMTREVVIVMKQIFSSIFNATTSLIPEVSLSVGSSSLRPDMNPMGVSGLGFQKSSMTQKRNREHHIYQLSNGFSVRVYSGNIVRSATNAIACMEDKEIRHRDPCSKVIADFAGKEYETNVAKYRQLSLKPGDVLVVDAGRNFDEIVEIYLAIGTDSAENEEEWVKTIDDCNGHILQKACHQQVYNMAMPLLGADAKPSFLPTLTTNLVRRIIEFSTKRPPECQLSCIHIVNFRDESTLAIRKAMEQYISVDLKRTGNRNMKGTIPKDTFSANIGKVSMEVEQNDPLALVANNGNLQCAEASQAPEQTTPKQMTTDKAANYSDHQCVICLESLDKEHKTLQKCKHKFCAPCIDRQFEHKPVCPTCGEMYGVITGNQPNGTMNVETVNTSLPGYPKCNTLVITYEFPDGIQGEEHPNPGVHYRRERRVAFLPDCPQGQLAVKLLRVAFDRRLVFTIGYSRTTGRDNVITWNDIHHKTNIQGGPQRFAYPDPQYLNRLMEELAAKGVTEKDLQECGTGTKTQ